MSKKGNSKSPMTPSAASRIQSSADKTGTNQGFKSRAQSAATKISGGDGKSGGGNSGGGNSGGGNSGGKQG